MKIAIRFFWLVCCLVVVAGNGRASSVQEKNTKPTDPGNSAAQAEGQSPRELIPRAETTSPRDTLRSFISLVNDLNELIDKKGFLSRQSAQQRPLVRAILDCLDVSEIPEYARNERAGEVAVCLKEVLDRVEIPAWSEIPGQDDLIHEDGSVLDRWHIPGTRITIVRIMSGPKRHEYLFSAGTADRIVDEYFDTSSAPYRTTGPPRSKGLYYWYYSAPGKPAIAFIAKSLPPWMKTHQLFGVTLWKWPAILLSVVFAILMLYLAFRIQQRLARLVPGRSLASSSIAFLIPIAGIAIPLLFKEFLLSWLVIRGNPWYYLSFAANLIVILAVIVGTFILANWISELVIASPRIRPDGLDAQLIRIVCKILGLVGAVVVFLVGGQYLGVPLTTLLASAGVGGLAVALAAQDMLKTLFGTLMLMADKPFRIGDRILFAKYDGIVEDIGLRSTRLRLLNGNQATIPNDELARRDIENIGRRPHIRRSSVIRLPLDTPRKKVQQAVEIIRDILQDHEGMDPQRPARVYFNDFVNDAFNIRMFYWFSPPDYWNYMEFSERVILAIFSRFEEAGINFSLPFRISEMGADKSK